MTGQAWHDMLTVFRALGGTADNICLRHGERGRGIFPVDPGRPIAIHIPENLLIKLSDIRFVDGKFRMKPETKATPAEIAFFEHYENNFSWGEGGRTETERVFEQAQTLPQSLRHKLKAEYPLGNWFDDPTDVLVLYARWGRMRMRPTAVPGQFEGRFLATRERGVRHLAVNALSHGTLYDDALPYDSKAWGIPFVVAEPAVAAQP